MQGKQENSLVNFTIYLIKQDIAVIDDIILKEKVDDEEELDIGQLFIKKSSLYPPRWSKIFNNYIDILRFGKAASPSALLLIYQNDRYFVITFGQGRYLLAPDCWEERFGLKVALNSIAEDSIRSIHKKTFDDVFMMTREQASKQIGAQDFGLDIEKDLLRAVVGYAEDKQFGERVSGMDSFKTSVRAILSDLPDLCSKSLIKFHDTSYKQRYPWVDHLSEIGDNKLIDELNTQVVKDINDKKFETCWTCVPEIIDWDLIAGFKYSSSSNSRLHYDIHLEDFINEKYSGDLITIDILKNRRVSAVNEDHLKIQD